MVASPHPVLGPPIDVRGLFAPERTELLELLTRLDEAGWSGPTPCPGWSVKDVVAHVLGDDLGRLARTRDGFAGEAPAEGEALAPFIDRINQEWVVAARRMSPNLLLSSLAWTGDQIAQLWYDLPMDAVGESVSWAGPEPAPVWLDAARDLTEYWVHRQQLHEALGRSDPQDPAVLRTVLDTFLRALPHTLRDQQRPAGTTFSFVVPGEAGGTWTVVRHPEGWRFSEPVPSAGTVTLDAQHTWRLCVRMLQPQDAERRAGISGDRELAVAALGIVSIIRSE